MKGENNPNSKINLEIANKIREDLKDWSIPRKTIIKNTMFLLILFVISMMVIRGETIVQIIQFVQKKKY